MEEGGRKLCLVVVLLELGEETPLQVQVQLTEEMEHREALEAGEDVEELEEPVLYLLILVQQEMEVAVELVAMEAAEVEAEAEGASVLVMAILQE